MRLPQQSAMPAEISAMIVSFLSVFPPFPDAESL
jgi:hypothetical protein